MLHKTTSWLVITGSSYFTAIADCHMTTTRKALAMTRVRRIGLAETAPHVT